MGGGSRARSLDDLAGDIESYELDQGEAECIERLAATLVKASSRSTDPYDVVDRARALIGEVPPGLRDTLEAFATDPGRPPGLVVRAMPVGPLGATPRHWSQAQDDLSSAVLLLVGEALGRSFGWATQQAGRLVHDVVPTAGDERVQLGSNSTAELTLHSEDAFHRFRAEWIGLLCLRNPNAVATYVSTLGSVELSADQWAALEEPAYPLLADLSHHPSRTRGPGAEVDVDIPVVAAGHVPTYALDASRGTASLRFDPYYTGIPSTPRHANALAALAQQLERHRIEVPLVPGELLLLDNHRAVHGRAPFGATYGDDERWLKRVCVSADLKRSRPSRHSSACRVVGCVDGACSSMLDFAQTAEQLSRRR